MDLTNQLLAAYGPWVASGIAALLFWFLRREIRNLDAKLSLLDGISATVIKMERDFENYDDRMVKAERDRLKIWEKIEKHDEIQSELKVSVAIHDTKLHGIEQHPAIRGPMVAAAPMMSVAPHPPVEPHHEQPKGQG